MVLNDKKIDDVFYKNVKKELSDKNKNIFEEAFKFKAMKKFFDLRVEIYKKLVLKKENLEFEKSTGETVKLKNQKDNFSETPEQKKFIKYVENKSKTIDYNLFKEYFNFKVRSALAKKLYQTKDKK